VSTRLRMVHGPMPAAFGCARTGFCLVCLWCTTMAGKGPPAHAAARVQIRPAAVSRPGAQESSTCASAPSQSRTRRRHERRGQRDERNRRGSGQEMV